jgi:hypothetical protein
MARQGASNVVAYLDDFFICERSKEECASTLALLIRTLRKLGFSINWSKVVDPTNVITFLGIEIDSSAMELRLPSDKLAAIKQELSEFQSRHRASKKQLQRLAGRLNWAASVVYGGRVFLRNIIDAIRKLKHDHHKIRLSHAISSDLDWWLAFMPHFNGKAVILRDHPALAVYTDACTEGGGAHWGQNWLYQNWAIDWPEVLPRHINEKEVVSAALAVACWSHLWINQKVYIFSDNVTTVSSINKGTSKNSFVMEAIKFIFWQSAKYNFKVKAIHIPGRNNVKADAISRLHDSNYFNLGCNPLGVDILRFPNQVISCHSLSYVLSSRAAARGCNRPRCKGPPD